MLKNCLICNTGFKLNYLGECQCIQYSSQNNFITDKYYFTALESHSKKTVSSINYQMSTYTECVSINDLFKNNCSYCYQNWKSILTPSLSSLEIVNTGTSGESYQKISLQLIGKLIKDSEIHSACRDQLYMNISQDWKETFSPKRVMLFTDTSNLGSNFTNIFSIPRAVPDIFVLINDDKMWVVASVTLAQKILLHFVLEFCYILFGNSFFESEFFIKSYFLLYQKTEM